VNFPLIFAYENRQSRVTGPVRDEL
jgi:hypothetical protein